MKCIKCEAKGNDIEMVIQSETISQRSYVCPEPICGNRVSKITTKAEVGAAVGIAAAATALISALIGR